MGVVNVTPDSFFDGGLHDTEDDAVRYAGDLVRDGADILDVGGESSRPGAAPVKAEEEQRRVLPVIERIKRFGMPVSVDTYKADTARKAIRSGATLVNDITAFRGDPEMVEVVAEADCTYIMMHMQGTPETMQLQPKYVDVIDDICAFFEERMNFAVKRGVRLERIWLDPGFGFGKTVSQNLELLRRLGEFRGFGRPILIGTSNKSTIGRVLNLGAEERTEGTAATVVMGIANGADVVRVHDVKRMARVAKMTDAILGRGSYD
ncbi:MAG: dihydropteroate synthase [Candidatus Hydrogenedentes bacterium]|nr:dihydropteroate synthase [Candidatus Hydrogenedentota bacterium]